MKESVIDRFEAWATDEGFNLTPNAEHGPRYASEHTQSAWRAFAYGPARDLLNAEPDKDKLPWKVAENGEIVAAFKHMTYAQDFVEDHDWHDSRKPVTITGPDDKDSEPIGNPDKLPRLVPITDWPRKTLDQMPEHDNRWCSYPVEEGPSEIRLLMRDGEHAHAVLNDGSMGRCCGTAQLIEVLDATPTKPQVVGELKPGMVTIVNGRLSICTKQFALVDLADGGHHAPTGDPPLTGEIYRFETEAGDEG